MSTDKKKGTSKDERVSALDRAVQTAMGEGREVGRDDDPARDVFPQLWDWLSRIYVGTNHVRQPATLTITLGPEGVLINLTDRDLGVSCGAVCPHLQDAFAAMESALTADVPAIRSWGKKEPRLRKRGAQ